MLPGFLQELESKISSFHGREDTILYASCFDANAGLFEQLLGPEDAVFSDFLNHASIIDGLRLCKAKKFRYEHRNMKGKVCLGVYGHAILEYCLCMGGAKYMDVCPMAGFLTPKINSRKRKSLAGFLSHNLIPYIGDERFFCATLYIKM